MPSAYRYKLIAPACTDTQHQVVQVAPAGLVTRHPCGIVGPRTVGKHAFVIESQLQSLQRVVSPS